MAKTNNRENKRPKVGAGGVIIKNGMTLLAELPSPLFPRVQAVFDAIKTGERYFEIKEEI